MKLNNQQRPELKKHCGVARHAWNWGLGLTRQITTNVLNQRHKRH
ncbi:MAG: helix-turn-helix domain-containing protein [Nostoc sp. SerVER01]|nr:helix-turn-helix domain-containing protein [Nostoc sp. SerVER01]MDZ8026745.1 helix-turn-helix domain-containing protein [Nostoc sp. DedQUE11]MDZ8075713.1 helix-turn-helix domain-containing protein [Nostoc sp. DedQUE01]MDZ8083805.1 helix-turn-helix domain-containing protein [Nostoc sp. DcaGUA01]